MPPNWTTPTPKIPASAQLEYAERLSPGGDLWAHRQNLKGLQNLQRDIQGFEMIFARVMDGGAKFLPGYFNQFNAVSIRGSVTPFLNAMRILCSEALAHASVAEVEDLQAAHDGFRQAMQGAEERRASTMPTQSNARILADIRLKVFRGETLDQSEIKLLADFAMSVCDALDLVRPEVKILAGLATKASEGEALGALEIWHLADLAKGLSNGGQLSRSEVKELVKGFSKRGLG